MRRNFVYAFIFLISFCGYGQYIPAKEFEVGPMLNYQYTSLYIANSVLNKEGEGSSNSGFEPNYAVGFYGMYYFKPRIGVGAELFYDRVYSTELGAENDYNSLTLIPYMNYDPFRRIRNFYVGGGIGVSFIQESPEYGSEVKEEDIRVITIPLKLSISYRIRNQFTAELGGIAEITEVVDNQVRRNAIFLGIKVPVNRVFGGYR